MLVTWEGFANCCQRLKICNPCNRWAPRVSGILWRQTSTVLFPSSIVVQAIWFSLKAKSLENWSCHFAEIIVVKETLTNYLFHTLRPASYRACCGFPWKGKCLVLQCWLSPGRAGASAVLKAPAQDPRRAALAAQPPVSGREPSYLTQVGQNSGALGCEGTRQEVRRGHRGRSPCHRPARCRQASAAAAAARLNCKAALEETRFKHGLL